jgi:CopG family nickel-responsive transcriptional regulator
MAHNRAGRRGWSVGIGEAVDRSRGQDMERFTISLAEELAREFDDLIAERGYGNRSEAVRDLIRRELESRHRRRQPHAHCVANLSYVYNHHERDLADRLIELQHEFHDLCVSTLHAHLDHQHCLECVILRGHLDEVQTFADRLIAERGVKHGQLNVVTAELGERHAHEHGRGRPHAHLKPRG